MFLRNCIIQTFVISNNEHLKVTSIYNKKECLKTKVDDLILKKHNGHHNSII